MLLPVALLTVASVTDRVFMEQLYLEHGQP